MRDGRAELFEQRRALLITIAFEEALFLVAFAAWTLVRTNNPDIFATEKPMDFMLLQASGLTHSFPPPDAWLSGHTVNYYYLGYAIFAMLGKMSSVDPRFGFNLANITVFALGCTGAYSLSVALTRSRWWGFAGSFALMLAGNLDGFFQAIRQIGNGGLNEGGLDLWCSTRIIDGGCANYHTITEFPIFSVLWNDLHPHVMAIPFAVLAIGFAVNAVLYPPSAPAEGMAWYSRLLVAAIAAGALFPINSWDYPTYLVLIVGGMYAAAYRAGRIAARQAAEIGAIVPISLLLYLPYFLTVHNSKSIGFNRNPTDLSDMLDVVGGLLLPLAIFAIWRFVCALAALAADPERSGSFPLDIFRELPTGAGWWLAGGTAFAVFALPGHTDWLYLVLIVAAGYAFFTRLRDEEAPTLVVLGLIVIAVAILLLSDFAYLRDNFDNSPNYRMNTVFKLYYQAWIVMAIGVPYAIFSIARALAAVRRELAVAWGVAAVLLAAALAVYPIEGAGSQSASRAANPGLDGLAYLAQVDPTDYRVITYIRDHLPANVVIAEADGSALAGNTQFTCSIEYWTCDPPNTFSRISALTGRPTLLGWPASHEALWQGAFGGSSDAQNAAAMLAQREADIRKLYTSTDPRDAMTIIQRYHVSYVYVGPLEHIAYVTDLGNPEQVLTKFKSFLTPVLTLADGTLYRVRP
jgi:YYY domain-containing protein